MKKNYYLFNPGRLSRKDNTLLFTTFDEQGQELDKRFIPIESVADFYCFGSLDANSALYNFLGKNGVAVHFFDYYEHYTGSFLSKNALLSGFVQVQQTRHYLNKSKRMVLAKQFVAGAAFNMTKVLRYYANRGLALHTELESIDNWMLKIVEAANPEQLMGMEGNIRQLYYSAFDQIVKDFVMENRSRRPPQNELNALISLGNSLCYAACLSAIHHTQLNPTISFLHQPGHRRYSLALDLAEIFKPILVDRMIFKLLNKKEIQPGDFHPTLEGIRLKDGAYKTFVKSWDERLSETIKHRGLGRNVSYKTLIRLEAYKLIKHVMNMEPYEPFKMYW